jgi:hypothetical protein
MNAAQRYIYAIHNAEKKAYAWAYYNYLTSSRAPPNTDEYKIGVMAAQAVRMNLTELVKE